MKYILSILLLLSIKSFGQVLHFHLETRNGICCYIVSDDVIKIKMDSTLFFEDNSIYKERIDSSINNIMVIGLNKDSSIIVRVPNTLPNISNWIKNKYLDGWDN